MTAPKPKTVPEQVAPSRDVLAGVASVSTKTRAKLYKGTATVLLAAVPGNVSAAEPLFIVRFIGAEIAPAKSAKLPWDGPPTGPAKAAMGIAAQVAVSIQPGGVLFGPAASKVSGEITGLAMPVFNQPDPQGKITLQVDGEDRQSEKLRKKTDTYSPDWGGVVFRDVDLARATLRLRLSEWDTFEDDPIGVCEVRPRALREAARAEGVAWVFCGDQTGNKILFMKISVQKQPPDTRGEGHERPE